MRHIIAAGLILVFQLTGISASAQGQKAELVVQTGHSNGVKSVALSPDGKLLASTSFDGTIKLWDETSGMELRTFTGHSEWVLSATFSPDGKTLVSGGYDKTIKLWDVESGKEIRTLTGHSGSVHSVTFGRDGKILASGGGMYDHTIKLWAMEGGNILRTLRGHSAGINSIAFSADGDMLASGSDDNTIKLWNTKSGTEIKTLRGHSSVVQTVAFSPDGKTLASGSGDASSTDKDTIKLWDVDSGSELQNLKGHSTFVLSVSFSPDGKTLASAGGEGDDTVKLWDVNSGKELKTLTGHSAGVSSVIFSPDGKMLMSGSDDSTIKIWDTASGDELKTLRDHSVLTKSVALSSDGKTLASGGGRGKFGNNWIKLWDIETGKDLRTLQGHTGLIEVVKFSPDGKKLASTGWDKKIKIWDVESGKELSTTARHPSLIWIVNFSPDGKTLVSGGGLQDNKIKLWNVESGTELRTLAGHLEQVVSLKFSPDGKTLASASHDKTIKLWEVMSGKELKTLRGHTDGVSAVAFSPDGKTLASGGNSTDGTIKLWDVESGTELRTLKEHSFDEVKAIIFSPDGKTLTSGSYDKTIKFWDAASGAEIKSLRRDDPSTKQEIANLFPEFYAEYYKVAASDRLIAEVIEGSKIKVSTIAASEELATLIAIDEKDWMVVTPNGLFDGTPEAWKQLIWRLDNNTFSYATVEAFYNEFWRPGLLQEIMQGKTMPPPEKDLSQVDIRQPLVKIKGINEQPTSSKNMVVSDKRTVKVAVEITDNMGKPRRDSFPRTSGAQDVRLFRNGSLVKVWRGDVLKGERSVTLETVIPVVAGENRLTAYAFNHHNVKSSDALLTVTGAESLIRPATAYVLAVGVNSYANPQYDLRYAVADAQAFSAEVRRQQEALGRYAKVEVMTLLDKEATKANILRALEQLSAKAHPEDAVIVYFAGHGTAQGNRFYLIPHDLGYSGNRENAGAAGIIQIVGHSVSDEELEAAFEKIDAGQLLMVIDACNSGQALEAEEKRRGPMNSKGLAQLAYEKGMYILTASQSLQVANEEPVLGHGYLTYVLLNEGLKGAADREPADGSIFLREWFRFAEERVPRLHEERREKKTADEVALLRSRKARQGLEGVNDVQRPRVFYRRELEARPLVVAKPTGGSPAPVSSSAPKTTP